MISIHKKIAWFGAVLFAVVVVMQPLGATAATQWVKNSSSATTEITQIVTSVDGNTIAAIAKNDYNYMHITTNRGATWKKIQVPFGRQDPLVAIAMTADGTKIVVASTTHVATYTDASGWVLASISFNYTGKFVTMSADGTHITAGTDSALYVSSDGGASWTTVTTYIAKSGILATFVPFNYLSSIASDASGMNLAVVSYGYPTDTIITSTDGGLTWAKKSTHPAGAPGYAVYAANGSKLFLYDGGDNLAVSTNNGGSWTTLRKPGIAIPTMRGFTTSADGTKLAIVADNYSSIFVQVSTDAGNTWIKDSPSDPYFSAGYPITSSADGSVVIATAGSLVYVRQPVKVDTTTTLNTSSTSTLGLATTPSPTTTSGTSTAVKTTPKSTPLPLTASTAATTSATVTSDGAVLIGSVTNTSIATRVGFNYGTTTRYGQATATDGSFGKGTFTSSVSDLDCGTKYHYRAYATNIKGTRYGADKTFTTQACGASTPTVSNSVTPTPTTTVDAPWSVPVSNPSSSTSSSTTTTQSTSPSSSSSSSSIIPPSASPTLPPPSTKSIPVDATYVPPAPTVIAPSASPSIGLPTPSTGTGTTSSSSTSSPSSATTGTPAVITPKPSSSISVPSSSTVVPSTNWGSALSGSVITAFPQPAASQAPVTEQPVTATTQSQIITPAIPLSRSLTYLDSGADVTALQNYLIQKGYLHADATGLFGKQTIAAVKALQTDLGITPVGIVGPQTRTMISGQVAQ